MPLSMITLFVSLLIQTLPPCDDIYTELMTAVDYKALTLNEAEEIYRRCLVVEY